MLKKKMCGKLKYTMINLWWIKAYSHFYFAEGEIAIKQILAIVLIFSCLFTLVGCSIELPSKKPKSEDIVSNTPASCIDNSVQMFSNDALLQEIYCADIANYGVYSSEALDIYLIACALYFDFQSLQILPASEGDSLSTQVKDYFTPYKKHPFIVGLNEYVDNETLAQRDGVIFPLLMYAFSMSDYSLNVDEVHTDVFENGEEFQSFLKMLYAFYSDTKAEEFFRSVEQQKNMADYLQKELPRYPINALLSSMEEYVGNKQKLFGEKSVKYRSVMTLYRPFSASFYTIDFGEEVYLVAQQSPHNESRNDSSLDITQTINTTLHEFLHTFINQPVYEQNDLITQFAKGRAKSDYTAPIYQNMEWHRIVDEAVVRVVETAIFREVMQDEQKAFNWILKKEIQSGQMPKLTEMYDALSAYEEDRSQYQTINDYLPVLISIMLC